MSSALDTLRAISESAHGDERNEINEQTPSRRTVGPEQGEVNSLNSFLSSSTDDLAERAAIIAEGADVSPQWAEGYAVLSSMPAPPGFSPERWRRIVDATGAFLDRWAPVAVSLGWTNLDVFGCDPVRPDARFDAMGLVLLLDRCEVVAVDQDGIDLITSAGARQRYRKRPLPNGTVSLWQLKRP